MNMQNSQQPDEQLRAFLHDELNDDDRKRIEEWISANEKNRNYFNDVCHSLLLSNIDSQLKTVDVDGEWDRFRMTAEPFRYLGNSDTAGYRKNRRALVRIVLATAAAAAVIGLFVFAAGWFSEQSPAAGIAVNQQKKPLNTSLIWRESNNSGRNKQVLLPDGSKVELYDGSELQYYNREDNAERKVILAGQAYFSVAKDSLKPFVVTGGEIDVTVLGTEFLVSATAPSDDIIVQLFEGKVAISSSDSAVKKLDRKYFLKPGQQFAFNRQNSTARVTYLKKAKKPVSDELIAERPSLPKNADGSWYMFNNQPLAQVFDQLELMYDVDILYSKNELSKIYFIGSFKKTDSLNDILDRIALLNNLKISREGEKLRITKAAK